MAFTDESVSQFITEKRYLRTGDCVGVEESRYVNVWRVAKTLCARPVPAAAEVNLLRNAEQFDAAKTELLDISTNEAVEFAARKIEILCGS